ncbi:MAG TPA: exodeoxyribonuclease VII small subunit [Candidatus Baltobacteraceae bacterium]|nr:exodeoxyribonuclease VII small subunit [Candidatus Baltobacteraceae bacterium]
MATNAAGEFEKSLARLEQIVAQLENENPNLDESVALFREGRELAKKCETLLRAAQTSIEAAANGEPARAQPAGPAPSRPSDDELPF